jgi:hypothetical protein
MLSQTSGDTDDRHAMLGEQEGKAETRDTSKAAASQILRHTHTRHDISK